MRPISEETMAILKSQNLTGQNRFKHSLRLEGMEYYTPITQTVSNTVSLGATSDFCIRGDGKVLYVSRVGLNIYLSVVDKEEDLMSVPNIGNTGKVLFTTVSKIFEDDNNVKLLRLKNGSILLFVCDGGVVGGTAFSTMVYKSVSGLGDDFVLIATLYPYSRVMAAGGEYGTSLSIPKPMQLSDGSIIAVVPFLHANEERTGFHIVKSTDNGVNWTSLTNWTTTSPFMWGITFGSLAEFDGKLLYLWSYDYTTRTTFYKFSEDLGATWASGTFAVATSIYEIDVVNDMEYVFLLRNDNIARIRKDYPVTIDYLKNFANWEPVVTYTPRDIVTAVITPRGTIHVLSYFANYMSDLALVRDPYSAPIQASSISISKGKSGANSASIQASNKDGALNPKNPESPLYGVLKTNKQIIIKQGYGEELIETFTGMIDDFDMSTWPQTTGIALRDNLKKALDQTITYGSQHTIQFETQTIETIVGYLCYLANIDVGTIETTGLSVAMTFSWCSYADAFQQLGDLASFEWGCDSYGKFYFRRDYQPDNMYVAYTFEEGVDLATLKYTISDKDLYAKVAVFGKSGESVISYEAPFLDAAEYNILPQKILKIDATEASTMDALVKIAERALSMMQSRTAIIQFTSIAIPWLEVGDFVGIYERSTGAASIYRLADISFQMDTETFTMSGTAYYYGDSIVPGELPTEVATQTPAPTVNLIPEMTSNVAPSGVARASSVYTAAYEPWQAFNGTSEDLYWNAITNTGWIEYQFPEKMIVDKYILKSRQLDIYNDAMPRDWTFQGFDGTQWVTLDTRTAQTGWETNESRTYLFANTVAYSKYRLNVTRNEGYIRLQLEQLAMYYGGGA